MSAIYSNSITDRLLACLVQNPTLCLDEKYKLDKNEFAVNKFHQILYVSIYNLACNGYKTISIMDLNEFLKPYEAQYNVYLDNDGDSYIATIIELTDADNFDGYYKEFRKLSCLTVYKDNGFDISKFWNEEITDEKNMENLNQYTIEDILNHYEGLQLDVKRAFMPNALKEEYKAGTDFLENKEKFKEEPLIGNSFQSEYLNGIFRGMYGFLIRVSKSGGGKSVLSMGDLCKSTITEYYDFKTQSFVKNKSRVGAGLFINTELDLRNEIDPIIIAWISGVPRNHILDGKYEENEEERVDKASQILLESELYIVDDPYFTTKSLMSTIKDYSFNKNIKTVCFDYIQNNGFVAKELSSETKVPQREDMVLLALTDRLKQVQRECDVSLISSVQTNGQEDNMEYPTESVLAGGKAQVRKTDGTMCMLPPTKKELAQLESVIARWNMNHNKIAFGKEIRPNNVIHLIKGRSSKYPKNIKIFQNVDFSNGRTLDMFCTDKFNNPIQVDKLVIEYDEK